MNTELILERAKGYEVRARCAQLIYQLCPDKWHWHAIRNLILPKEDWHHFNNYTILNSIAEVEQPRTYLEIGVNKGASLVQVLKMSPKVDAACFDLWVEHYASEPDWPCPTSSPEFVVCEMQRIVPDAKISFFSGDTKKTLPEFFALHPDFMADVALVDGDHSAEGAEHDLSNVWPHAKAVVFDDIHHPAHGYLDGVWDRAFEKFGKGWSQVKDHSGVGTAVAFRP